MPLQIEQMQRYPSTGERLAKSVSGAAQDVMGKLQERHQSKQAETLFNELAEDNPDVPMYKNMAKLWGSKLPFDQKKALAESVFKRNPLQEMRLQLDYASKHYGRLIKELREQRKTARHDEKAGIDDQIKKLMEAQSALSVAQDLHFPKPESPEAQAPAAAEAAETSIPATEAALEEAAEEKPTYADKLFRYGKKKKAKGKKAKFDFKNKEHIKRRDEVLQKAKGNKAEADKLLHEEFEL